MYLMHTQSRDLVGFPPEQIQCVATRTGLRTAQRAVSGGELDIYVKVL